MKTKLVLIILMNVKDFIITGSDKDYDQYQEYLEAMNGFIEEAKVDITQPDRKAIIDKVDDTVTNYEKGFEDVYQYRAKRNSELNDYLDIEDPDFKNNMLFSYFSKTTCRFFRCLC